MGGVGPYCLCIPGHFIIGDYGCHPCYPGTFKYSYGFEACHACPSGTYSNLEWGSTGCSVCSDGQYVLPSQAGCANCTLSGQLLPFALGMDLDCLITSCEDGYVLSWDRTACMPCPDNWTWVGPGCEPPPLLIVGNDCYTMLGMISFEQGCIPCPVNWTAVNAETCVPSSQPCPSGSVVAVDGKTCIPCAPGWYQQGESVCVPCGQGTYSEFTWGSTACIGCPQGTYSSSIGLIYDASQCSTCKSGTYAPNYGMSECIQCHQIVINEGVGCGIPTCGYQQYFSMDQQECLACTVCQDTTYVLSNCTPTSNTVCASCRSTCPFTEVLTKYCTMFEDSVCANVTVCPQGTYSVPSTVTPALFSCPSCIPGKYNDIPGASACKQCSVPGTYPNGQRSGCVNGTQCEPGAYLTPYFYCALCSPGTGSCMPCPANTYAARAGQVSCTPCPNGTFAAKGSSACSTATCISGITNH